MPLDITSQETIILSRYPAEQNCDELGPCEEHKLISNSLFFIMAVKELLSSSVFKPHYSYLWKVDSMNIYFQVFVWIKSTFLGKLPWQFAVLIIHSKKKYIINYCNNGYLWSLKINSNYPWRRILLGFQFSRRNRQHLSRLQTKCRLELMQSFMISFAQCLGARSCHGCFESRR